MGSGRKSQVGFGYYFSASGRVWVPKKSGFPPGFRDFSYKRNQKSGSGQVRVPFLGFRSGTKKVGFSPGFWVFGYPNPSLYIKRLCN